MERKENRKNPEKGGRTKKESEILLNEVSERGHDFPKHKQTEEELKASEELYKALVETTGTGYVIIDTDGRVLDANPEYVRLTGYRTLKEIIGKNVMEWTAGYEKEKNAEAVEKCARDGYIRNLEIDYMDSAGKITTVGINATVVQIQGTAKILTLCRDITDRKRADLQAKERMKELQAFYGLAGITEREGITLDQLIREFTNLLPDSWRYNEIAYSRIVIGDSEFCTNNFKESAWKQSAPVRVHGSVVGKIEVGYLEERPELDEGPFLKEERVLIDALSERLGRIIERVQTEKKLQESEERYRSLAESITDNIFIIDREDTIRFVNTHAAETLHLPADEIIGKPRKKFFPPDVADHQGMILQKAFETGEPSRNEERIVFGNQEFWQDNVLIPLKDKTGNVTSVMGVSRDITERKVAEEELLESRQRFQGLVETLYDWIWEVDYQGRYTYVSPRIKNILGYEPEELLGKTPFDIMPAEEMHRVSELFGQLIAEQTPIIAVENICLHKDGHPVIMETNGLPFYDTKGNLKGYRGADRNITERKRVEEKLKFSNVLLATEQDVSIDGSLVVDDAGKIISFNRRFIEICGIPPDVVASRSDERTLQSVIDKLADPEEFLARVNYLYAHRDEKSREEIALKDGRVLDRYSAPMSGSDGKYYGRVWNFRDITEQKLVEEVIRESEERYRTLAEASPDQIFIVGRDDTIKYVNPAALKMFRLPYDQVIGTSRKNLFPPSIADAQGILLKKVFETGELVKTEEKIQFGTQELWIDTSFVPLKDETGHITAVLGISRDITERRRIEEALRENEIRYRSLFEGAGEGILVADIETKKFLHANPAMLRMLGYSEEELITLGIGDIHPKESLDYVISKFMAQARGEKLMAENLPVLRKDKSIFYADVSSTRILIDEKMCNVGFFSDITERKKSEDILKRFNEELEQQVKSRTVELNVSLKEKEGLLKEIHHRVRNNLQIVSSIISLQAKSVSDPGSFQQIQEIRMRIGTLALVHEIAYLAKTPESINMRDFLHRCTSKVIDEFKCEPGRIDITITAENVPVVLNQAVPCSLIVNELLMNSIRHAFPHKRHGEIKIGFAIANGNYVLEYSDDGVGFPEGMHPQQAETGGVSLIRGLAKQIRGTVESTTRPGTGYTLTFPAGTGGA